jgi:hypothetical protein
MISVCNLTGEFVSDSIFLVSGYVESKNVFGFYAKRHFGKLSDRPTRSFLSSYDAFRFIRLLLAVFGALFQITSPVMVV